LPARTQKVCFIVQSELMLAVTYAASIKG